MPAYFIFNYNVVDPDGYRDYARAARTTLAGAGARVLVADVDSQEVEGMRPGHQTIVIEFPDKAAAMAWYDSPGYQEVVGARHAATQGFALLCDGVSAG
jgi:uncharacterized protein (DUF1330 family)